MIRAELWEPADGLSLEPNAVAAAKEIDRNLALTAPDEEISAEDVQRVMPQEQGAGHELASLLPLLDQPLREARDAFEKLYFEHHLRLEGGNMTRLAERSGLERTHLYRKLKQLDVKLGKRGEE